MFSKPLYKQSWKANWGQWSAITVVSTFILTIIMIMSGGDGLGSFASSFTEMFVKDALEAKFQKTAMNYYSVTEENLPYFDEALMDKYLEQVNEHKLVVPTEEYVVNAYIHAAEVYQAKLDTYIKAQGPTFVEGSQEYLELMGVAMFTLNPDNMFGQMYEEFEVGSTPEDYDVVSLVMSLDNMDYLDIWTTNTIKDEYYDATRSIERINYRRERIRDSASIFLGGNLVKEETVNQILEVLADTHVTREMYNGFGFDYPTLKKLGGDTIVTYMARLDFEISQIDPNAFLTEEEYLIAIAGAKENLKAEVSESLIAKLPGSLGESMVEMQDFDVYTMMVGNMYYKIVGLLISVVFVIIIGVNLIAGQVDSGSMVYILATGTKRETITFTQMVFFVTSTFLLYVVQTIAAVTIFFISPPTASVVSVGSLLLFNLGSFFVTMALGGIIYLASCIFNRSKNAMALGGGFAVLTLVFTILGLFGSDMTPAMMRMDALNLFNSFSLVTLFDINAVVDGLSLIHI